MLWKLQEELAIWTRPSLMQHWFITRAVKAGFVPVKLGLEVISEYWKTWHSVYREPKK
jgi:hypothetical protein